MRILMINCEYPPIGGGAAQANSQLLRQFAKQPDLELDLLTAGVKPCQHLEQFATNIKIHRIPIAKKNLHYWRKIEVLKWLHQANRRYQEMAQQKHYDLAHAFFAFPSGYPCYRLAKKMPFIISLRGSDVPGYNVRLGLDYILLAPLFRKIWNSAQAVIANSIGLRDLAKQFTPAIDIPVIPNGVDTEIFTPADSGKQLNHPIRAITVARLIKRKRLDLLISAIAQARQAGLPMELTIVGQGNLLQSLRQHAESLNILEHIIFLGRLPAEQMPQVYRQHDIFLASSAHEGMSNAMLEAMASALPIVSTPCEGVQELITDNGIVVNQQTPQAIAQAICKLADDSAQYQTMSQNARKHAEKFSWQTTAKQYIQVYKKVIGSACRPLLSNA